ncbi:unnamed protein product [Merluccius merluccius]
MDAQVHPGSPVEPDPPWADPVLLGGETQLDFFRKLGYSAVQVRGAMQKVGGADTDRVLGELVRTGAGPESGPCRGEPEPGTRGARGPGRPGTPEDLRPVVIDGSNVAMSHGNKEVFSCLGIQLAVRFFQQRGHSDIIVFVPSWRTEPSRPDVPISDQHLLRELERQRLLVLTPSRRVAGRRLVCYDDRFIVKEAFESGGVIVSNDSYRDLQAENPQWRRLLQENLLMFFFISDKFVVPDDPLGRHGPTLDNFLRRVPKVAKKHPCPYGRKCTYGMKCKFLHPARGPQSHPALADELREKGKPPSPHQGPGSGSPGGSGTSGSTQYPSLAEEMSQKLSLHHQQQQSSSSTSRKGSVSENLGVRGHTSRKHPSKKEKVRQPSPGDREPLRSTGSQVQLDSGLGSIENQTMDSGDHGGCRYGPQYYPAVPACSCCWHAAPALANPAGAAQHHPHPHPHPQHHPPPPGQHPGALSPDGVAYGAARYLGYGAPPYPGSTRAHSHPTDFQNRRALPPAEAPYWSDPYGAARETAAAYGEGPAHWGFPPPAAPPGPPAGGREAARKKLLAIFNSRLVDRAMETFPHEMDPQVLVAEIILLQSQDRAGRTSPVDTKVPPCTLPQGGGSAPSEWRLHPLSVETPPTPQKPRRRWFRGPDRTDRTDRTGSRPGPPREAGSGENTATCRLVVGWWSAEARPVVHVCVSGTMWQSLGLTVLVTVATLVCVLLFMLFGWYVVWQLFLSKFKFLRELLGEAGAPRPSEARPADPQAGAAAATAAPPRSRPRGARQRMAAPQEQAS